MARHADKSQRSLSHRIAERIVGLPRLVRVLLAGFFALAVTLALSPLVDLIYVQFFFSYDTRIVPSLVTATVGLIVYLLGWWLMVGTIGERPIARTALLWYCGTGLLAVVVVVFLLIRGVTLFRIFTST